MDLQWFVDIKHEAEGQFCDDNADEKKKDQVYSSGGIGNHMDVDKQLLLTCCKHFSR